MVVTRNPNEAVTCQSLTARPLFFFLTRTVGELEGPSDEHTVLYVACQRVTSHQTFRPPDYGPWTYVSGYIFLNTATSDTPSETSNH